MATATTNAVITSVGAPAGAVGEDATHVSYWSAETGGDYLGSRASSTDPDALVLGQSYTFPVGSIVFTETPGAGRDGGNGAPCACGQGGGRYLVAVP